eukprot:352550-Chlamydomonas_euryale.AAC.15
MSHLRHIASRAHAKGVRPRLYRTNGNETPPESGRRPDAVAFDALGNTEARACARREVPASQSEVALPTAAALLPQTRVLAGEGTRQVRGPDKLQDRRAH